MVYFFLVNAGNWGNAASRRARHAGSDPRSWPHHKQQKSRLFGKSARGFSMNSKTTLTPVARVAGDRAGDQAAGFVAAWRTTNCLAGFAEFILSSFIHRIMLRSDDRALDRLDRDGRNTLPDYGESFAYSGSVGAE
jgi:hypothetical protein